MMRNVLLCENCQVLFVMHQLRRITFSPIFLSPPLLKKGKLHCSEPRKKNLAPYTFPTGCIQITFKLGT